VSDSVIPFNLPSLVGNELAYMARAAVSGHISGDGPFTSQCQGILEAILGVPKVLLTTSCTHALELVALLLDIRPGDEVIIPSFTFVSSANAFVLRGARPVFIDIRPDTLNIDERLIERLITPRTRAIVVVHYAGVACEMDTIMAIARQHGLVVIEDNAHGLFGRYKGRLLGTFGPLATLSFHETKNNTCGEGGALVITDPQYVERAEIIREKGTDRSRFFRGEIDKYTWIAAGSSYLPADILAAMLVAQFEARDHIQRERQRIWDYYAQSLRAWAEIRGVGLPVVPPRCDQPYHLFYLLLPTLAQRQALLAGLKAQGIRSAFHYVPLHLSDMGRRFGGRLGDCPITEDLSDRLLRLPFYNTLSDGDQRRIVEAVCAFGE
jgi:dTDP-4-amino-4,6-dideoxygalactose transaminase